MALSEWKSTQSDGTLPNSKTASLAQYKRFLIWEVDLSSFGIGSQQGTGRWKIQWIDGSGNAIFEQTIEITLQIVSLGGIGLQLYTWQIVREKIITTRLADGATNIVPAGAAFVAPVGVVNSAATSGRVDDANSQTLTAEQIASLVNPSWLKTLGGAAPTSEFGTMIPGGGSGVTNFTALIEADWQSPVYQMPVAIGVKLDVLMDAWGLGASTRPEWQFRFEESARTLDVRLGFFGEMVTARGVHGGANIQGGHTFTPHAFPQSRGWIEGASDPSLVMLPDGREVLGVLQADGYWEYVSYDTQRTWKKWKYPGEVPGTTTTEPIFEAGVAMPQLIRLEDGLRLALTISDNRILVRRIGTVGPGDLIDVGPVTGEASYSLDEDDSGIVWIFGESGTALYKSEDGGMKFQPVEQLIAA